MDRIPVILDGDPGHDDAIAWMIAAASPMLNIKAVTTVAGNKDIENVTRNALNVCSLFGIDAPVAKGAHGPLVVEGITAGDFHGVTGLDGADLPPSSKILSKDSAVELMVKVIEESDEQIVIIGTGAETNLAALLLYRPDLKGKIKACYLMGGGIGTGNWTPAAEFNILVDPEAASIVFESGVPVVMSGLDVTEKALIYPEDVDRIRAIGTQVSNIVSNWLDFFGATHAALGYKGWPLHDPCAVLSLIKPEIFTIEDAYLQVDKNGIHTRGEVLADYEDRDRLNGKVVLNLDRQAFVEELIKAVEHFTDGEV
ncbi:nucleoside hydrolase [Gudongella sp. DL1XJH-153]|uniref:nucleoside hydrolase n=1 Tax=Gudongella sp. DL1XJH-153 TaxID=3409804 RepID=UPI003BB67BF8